MIRLRITPSPLPKFLCLTSPDVLELIFPIVRGAEISTDNTCEAVGLLQEFMAPAESPMSMLSTLRCYKIELEEEVALYASLGEQANHCVTSSQKRLNQVNVFISALEFLRAAREFIAPLRLAIPNYPRAIHELFAAAQTNAFSFQLRTPTIDRWSQVPAPTFSVNREEKESSILVEGFHNIFSAFWLDLPRVQNAIALLVENIPEQPRPNFEQIKAGVQQACKAKFNYDLNVDVTNQHELMSAELVKSILRVDNLELVSPKEIAQAIIGACCDEAMLCQFCPVVSRFTRSADESSVREVATAVVFLQFLLAEINIFCRAKKLFRAHPINMGDFLEKNDELRQSFLQVLRQAMQEKVYSFEMVVMEWVNQHAEVLQLQRRLTSAEQQFIVAKFLRDSETLEQAQHHDDGIIAYPDEPGPFFIYQHSLCCSFSRVMQVAYPEFEKDFFVSRERFRFVDGVRSFDEVPQFVQIDEGHIDKLLSKPGPSGQMARILWMNTCEGPQQKVVAKLSEMMLPLIMAHFKWSYVARDLRWFLCANLTKQPVSFWSAVFEETQGRWKLFFTDGYDLEYVLVVLSATKRIRLIQCFGEELTLIIKDIYQLTKVLTALTSAGQVLLLKQLGSHCKNLFNTPISLEYVVSHVKLDAAVQMELITLLGGQCRVAISDAYSLAAILNRLDEVNRPALIRHLGDHCHALMQHSGSLECVLQPLDQDPDFRQLKIELLQGIRRPTVNYHALLLASNLQQLCELVSVRTVQGFLPAPTPPLLSRLHRLLTNKHVSYLARVMVDVPESFTPEQLAMYGREGSMSMPQQGSHSFFSCLVR